MKKNLLLLLAAIVFITACIKNKGAQVTTFAGNGSLGAKNGKADNASFSNLMGLAIDSGNNIYVADSRNNLVRKISAEGMVTTLAGSGSDGSADGKGPSASFFFPTAIAAGAKGVVYLADTHNSLIRKIMPDGTVTTIAGRPTPEILKRRDTSARFDNPYGIAVDKDGNVFVADWDKDEIKKIDPAGKITVFAGTGERGSKDGKAASATFYLPEGIAFDKKGNLYIADCYNNMIRKVTPGGVVTTLAGHSKKGSADGKGPQAAFWHPDGVTTDNAGNVYVADVGNNKIRKITPDGDVTTLAGTGAAGAANGNAGEASFYHPYGVVADNAGNIYVADYQNNLIRKISF